MLIRLNPIRYARMFVTITATTPLTPAQKSKNETTIRISENILLFEKNI
jgi:hypothetical protein